MSEKILHTEYSEEMKTSYLNYSMSVITSRAIPDIRDGLKPVQRRVLYDMNELGVHFSGETKKSARICGDTMGKYHPHGDSSIYETLVVMAQGFKKNIPFIIGQGNFGSIEGDTAAAQRYTEAKLSKFSDNVILKDLDKTVEFVPNYDESLKEPEVLPARFPNFLLNGAEGIAVGMATSSPTHNLSEICDLIIAYIKNQDMKTKSMIKYLKGPDFPTGGIIANKSELLNIYETGVGKLKLRGKVVFEKGKNARDKDKLVVTEIPYTMIGDGISKFMQDTALLCENKTITDITDIYNHSNKDGIRIVLELKKDVDYEKIINILYKKTKLQDTFSVNMLAIVNKRPETMTLKTILDNYLAFQYELINKKYNNLLNKENEKKEIEEGLIKAVDLIDAIIAMLRASKSREDAKTYLMTGKCKSVNIKDKKLEKIAKTFDFTSLQADAILDMKLYRLIGLELLDLNNQYKETLAKIKEYKVILKDKNKVNDLIIEDIKSIKKEYGTDRKTELIDAEEIVIEEVKKEAIPCVYVEDKFGYCKNIELSNYEKNKEIVDSENLYVFETNTDDKAIIFSSSGNMYQIKLDNVPMKKAKDKGVPIDNLSKFESNKEIVCNVYNYNGIKDAYFFIVTKKGLIKLVDTIEYETSNKTIAATKLNNDDEVAKVILCYAEKDLVIRTNENNFLRLKPEDIPLLKRATKGVKGIGLKGDDFVIDAFIYNEDDIIKVSGKNVKLNYLKVGSRGNKGSKLH